MSEEVVVNGDRMRSCRVRAGLGRRAVADGIGRSYSHVANIELGIRQPGAPTAYRIAQVIGVPLTEFAEIVPAARRPPGRRETTRPEPRTRPERAPTTPVPATPPRPTKTAAVA